METVKTIAGGIVALIMLWTMIEGVIKVRQGLAAWKQGEQAWMDLAGGIAMVAAPAIVIAVYAAANLGDASIKPGDIKLFGQ